MDLEKLRNPLNYAPDTCWEGTCALWIDRGRDYHSHCVLCSCTEVTLKKSSLGYYSLTNICETECEYRCLRGACGRVFSAALKHVQLPYLRRLRTNWTRMSLVPTGCCKQQVYTPKEPCFHQPDGWAKLYVSPRFIHAHRPGTVSADCRVKPLRLGRLVDRGAREVVDGWFTGQVRLYPRCSMGLQYLHLWGKCW